MSKAYPLVMVLTTMAGLLWIGLAQPRIRIKGLTPLSRLDSALAATMGGLLGARAGFVVSHWSYFETHLGEILAFWRGGLSWSGAALGGSLALAGYAALTGRPFWPLADGLAIPASIVSAGAWFGCMLDGCSYGRRLDGGLLAPLSPDLLGNLAPRWPTQAIGVIYSLALLGGLLHLSDRKLPQGVLAGLALTLIAGGALGLSFTRADPVPMPWGIRLDGLAAGALLALGLGGLALRAKRG